MLKLRKEHKNLFIYGNLEILDYDNDKTFTFVKELPDARAPKAYVVLNFSNEPVKYTPLIPGEFKLIVTNVSDSELMKLLYLHTKVEFILSIRFGYLFILQNFLLYTSKCIELMQ